MPKEVKVGVPGFVQVSFTMDELARYRRRFRRAPLLGGPCVLLPREQGTALDLGWGDQEPGWSPWFWEVHGLEPQQWLLLPETGDGRYRLNHAGTGLALTAGRDEGSWPTVETATDVDRQVWELVPTDDRTAFLVRSAATGMVLDATQEANRGDHPVMWADAHWAPWQQWVIARLPITS